jgi:hypothetical protein
MSHKKIGEDCKALLGVVDVSLANISAPWLSQAQRMHFVRPTGHQTPLIWNMIVTTVVQSG